MKALVKREAKPGLWLEDVPEPQVGVNDVLIRVERTGICGTDLHIYKWDDWARRTIRVPMVIGHEFVGEVVAVGSNVSDFFPGEVVSAEGHVVCGRCRNCLAGRRHLCKDTVGIGVNRTSGCKPPGLSNAAPAVTVARDAFGTGPVQTTSRRRLSRPPISAFSHAHRHSPGASFKHPPGCRVQPGLLHQRNLP